MVTIDRIRPSLSTMHVKGAGKGAFTRKYVLNFPKIASLVSNITFGFEKAFGGKAVDDQIPLKQGLKPVLKKAA